MSKSTPSLMALLGLVAVAGYQNRGRIGDMLSDARSGSQSGGNQGFLSEIGGMFSGDSNGRGLSGALGDLVGRFRDAGRPELAESWVSDRDNAPLQADEIGRVLDDETLAELSAKTGLDKSELQRRLSVALPDVVNRMTPNGRLPTDVEAQSML